MTTTLILSNSNDGYIVTGVSTWNDALNGFNATPATAGGTELVVGSDVIGIGYSTYQTFLQFDYTRPTNEVETGVAIGVHHSQIHNNASCVLWFVADDWGGTITSGDWVNPLAMATLTLNAPVYDPQASGTSQYVWAGSDELSGRLRGGGSASYRFVVATDRQMTYDLAPGVSEWAAFWSAESSLDPAMVVSTVPRTTLYEVLAAQVQLSDGTWVVLESNGATSPTILLRHIDSVGNVNTKATIPVAANSASFTAGSIATSTGSQQLSLVRDNADNLYVIGWQGGTSNYLAVKAYIKQAGYSWIAQTTTAGALPGSNTIPTQFVGAWHNLAGGTIVVLVSRCTSDGYRGVNSEMSWAIVDANVALTGTGTLIRNSGVAVGLFVPTISSAQWITQSNDTGTGLDVTALSTTKGVVHTWSRRDRLGVNQPTCKARYILNSSGTGFDSVFFDVPETSSGTWGVKTAAGKLRVLPIDQDTCATVSSDSDAGWGLTVAVLRNSGTLNSFTLLGRVRLSNESLTTMPSPTTLAESQAWDAVLVQGPGKIWVFYFDTANNRRLMRTAISLSTYSATREEIEVFPFVGAAGSTNLAIRVQRGSITPRKVLISVANRDSLGVLSTLYFVNTPNEAPTAPTLATRANFDAGNAATFTWAFNDPDIGDTQSSFEVDINTSTGTDVYDTGQLNGSIGYRGIGTFVDGNNVSVVPTMPTGWQPGDLLLIATSIRNSGTGTVNTPTGWSALVTSGNFAILGRIARTGDTAPTVTFANGAAGATTWARMAAWYGTDQNIATVVNASNSLLNASAQNVAYPALSPTANNCVVMAVGWKQNSWTSSATAFGTEIADNSSAQGSTSALAWDYTTQGVATTLAAGSFVITGGVAAISRGIVLAIRPYQAPTTSSFTLPAGLLVNGTAYQWRARTWDAANTAGAWSAYSTFSAGSGGTVTITDPASDNPANINTSYYPVQWSLTGATQNDVKVEVYRSDTNALVYSTGWVTSAATSQTVTGLLSDIQQRIEVTTRTAGLVVSNTGTRLITPSYATPDIPTFTATPTSAGGYTLIATANPSPTGSRPAAIYNQVQRQAVTGDDQGEPWMTIGAVNPNGQWLDYTAASNVTYNYQIAAVAASGNARYSATAAATLCFSGVWVHDPVDAANVTAANYLYGGQGKGDELTATEAEGIYYAGRNLPVFEFGEHENEVIDIPVQVPFGDDWNAQIADLYNIPRLRSVLCVRDARGRRIFGVVTKVSRTDEKWGTGISFQITRVDYDETWIGGP